MGVTGRIDNIKAISFDGTGTLWNMDTMMRLPLNYVLEQLNRLEPQAASKLTLEKMMEIRMKVAAEFRCGNSDFKPIGFEAFRRTLKSIGKPDDILADQLNQLYLKHRALSIEIFDDALPVLRALQTKYNLGLLSNGRDYPENTCLPEICRFAVFSQNYEFEKPDPRIFRITLEKAGCSNEQLLHVGDSLVNDVAGATGAGIKSVWLNRSGETNSTGIMADFEIRSLQELLDIIR